MATAIVLVSLFYLTRLEGFIDKIHQSRTYKITSVYKEDLLKSYEALFEEHRLHYKRIKQTKNEGEISGTWLVQGSEKNHNRCIKVMLHDPSIKIFEF
jgi:putative Mg2+ transporter-C (MgtC) family protein